MHPAPEQRPHCPACSQPGHLVRDERLVGEGTLVSLRCTACNWEQVEPHGSQAACAKGAKIYDAEMADLQRRVKADGARINAEQEVERRRKVIEDATIAVRTWATGPVENRGANFGKGYVVRPPDLRDGVTLEGLDQSVQALYPAARREAEEEAKRQDQEIAARLAQRPVIERQLWADHAARDREAARRRREERSDVELSRPT